MQALESVRCIHCKEESLMIIDEFFQSCLLECSCCGRHFFFDTRHLNLKRRILPATEDIQETFIRIKNNSAEKENIMTIFAVRNSSHSMAVGILKILVHEYFLF